MTWRSKPQRCGWCIDGRHANCVVIVETGLTRSRELKKQFSVSIWRCKCWECDYCNDTKCLDCQRTGVVVVENRCPDRKACQRARERTRKARQRVEEKAS